MKNEEQISKLKIGTYSNNGLSFGIPELDDSLDIYNELKTIIESNKDVTEKGYKDLSQRLGEYIKQNIGAYRSFDDFDNWFWSNKVERTVKRITKISDEVFLDAAKEYTEQLNRYIKKDKEESKPRVNSFSWSGNDDQLQLLYDKLVQEKLIHKNTLFIDFKCLFQTPANKPKNPIVWIGTIPDLICFFDCLNAEGLIDSKGVFPMIEKLELLQSSKGTILTQNSLNVNKTNYESKKTIDNMPKRYKVIEKIIKKIKDIKTS